MINAGKAAKCTLQRMLLVCFWLRASLQPDEQERAHVQEWAKAVQAATQDSVEIASVDQVCTGDEPEQDAWKAGIELVVVKLPEAKKGFVL